jgi:hypothetical protein
MSTTVDGIYHDGCIELLEKPIGISDGRVRVTIEPVDRPAEGKGLIYGKYREGRQSEPEDFEIAEWRGDRELSDDLRR